MNQSMFASAIPATRIKLQLSRDRYNLITALIIYDLRSVGVVNLISECGSAANRIIWFCIRFRMDRHLIKISEEIKK